jgi:hypothetical protein
LVPAALTEVAGLRSFAFIAAAIASAADRADERTRRTKELPPGTAAAAIPLREVERDLPVSPFYGWTLWAMFLKRLRNLKGKPYSQAPKRLGPSKARVSGPEIASRKLSLEANEGPAAQEKAAAQKG